jgi:hypothetical protein
MGRAVKVPRTLAAVRWILVVLVLSTGCRSYKDDVETICNAEDYLEDDNKLAFSAAAHPKKAEMLMAAITKKVKTDEGKKLLSGIAAAGPAGKFELLRTEAAKSGLTVCAFADFLEHGGNVKTKIGEPPEPSVSASTPPPPAKEIGVLKIVDTKVTGKLAPEPIVRIIRANFPKFRACYAEGLERDDSMKGTVTAKLTITAAGKLENVALASDSTLKDEAVRKCVLGVYQSLTFPLPDTGKAQVTSTIEYRRD